MYVCTHTVEVYNDIKNISYLYLVMVCFVFLSEHQHTLISKVLNVETYET